MTTAVDKWPAYARLSAVATAGHLPTAPTPPPGTRPEHVVQLAAELEHLPNAKKLLKGSLCNVCGNRPSATRCWDIFCWCCSASR